jgi:hypothetical protein
MPLWLADVITVAVTLPFCMAMRRSVWQCAVGTSAATRDIASDDRVPIKGTIGFLEILESAATLNARANEASVF